MNYKIFINESKKDEKTKKVAYPKIIILYFFLSAILVALGIPMILASLDMPSYLETILIILSIIIMGILPIKPILRLNIPKFIEKDGIVYAIRLIGKNEDEKSNKNREVDFNNVFINDNVSYDEYLKRIDKEEQENINKYISETINDLNKVLDHLKKFPGDYHVNANDRRSFLDNLLMYNIENQGMSNICTEDLYDYHFLILKEPKVIKVTKKYFVVEFLNECNEVCNVKFANIGDSIINFIDKRV